jgi:hypothetical protein
MSTEDQKQPGRIRRSTLERFNDEMSLLDRPIAQDIDPEFYEAEPPSKRPRIVATLVAAIVLGGGGFLFLSRPGGGELAAVPAAATPAAMIPAPRPAAPAAAPAIAVVPEVEADVEAEVDAVPSDVPSVAAAIAPSAWTKIGARAGSKHARPAQKIRHRHRR